MTDVTVCTAIGLGANLGEPEKTLNRAVRQLAQLEDSKLIACSGTYYSYPLGPSDQPDYVNKVILMETSQSPHRLLDALQAIEIKHDRSRDQHWGARTLDLDLIVYGDTIIHDERLTIPHPHAHRRSFVLEPLAEIAPDMVIPGHGSAAMLLATVNDNLIYRRPADAG